MALSALCSFRREQGTWCYLKLYQIKCDKRGRPARLQGATLSLPADCRLRRGGVMQTCRSLGGAVDWCAHELLGPSTCHVFSGAAMKSFNKVSSNTLQQHQAVISLWRRDRSLKPLRGKLATWQRHSLTNNEKACCFQKCWCSFSIRLC